MNGLQRNYAQGQTNQFLQNLPPPYDGKGYTLRASGTPIRDMTAADLGIVDELLDDKIGMEP